MLKAFLDVALQLSDLRPRYTGERCLLERHAVGGCDRCEQACPHDAVRLSDHVEILADACTGCGLCVQACPSGALEYDLLPVLGMLKDQGVANPSDDPVPASLRCAEVPGDGPQVACLARVTPAHLLASAAWGQKLDLIHGQCSTCRIGGPGVPEKVRATRQTASAYRQHLPDARPQARMMSWSDLEPSSLPVLTSSTAPPKPVSRRGALNALWGSTKRGLAQAIPDRPLPGVDAMPEPGRIGDEWLWRRRALKPRPSDGTPQHWPAPAVNESCTFCQVCETLCPTDAITREAQPDGTISLNLEIAACNGCNACVVSCPVDAMRLETSRVFEDLERTVVMRRSQPVHTPVGSCD
jgi:NAD-dependent dihydropyrimidine dehydrogenase PreA subunit